MTKRVYDIEITSRGVLRVTLDTSEVFPRKGEDWEGVAVEYAECNYYANIVEIMERDLDVDTVKKVEPGEVS